MFHSVLERHGNLPKIKRNNRPSPTHTTFTQSLLLLDNSYILKNKEAQRFISFFANKPTAKLQLFS